MQSDQAQFPQIVTIYKAPQQYQGQNLLEEGFQPTDFSYNSPYLDGSWYLADPNDRSIAEESNQNFKKAFLKFRCSGKLISRFQNA
jgi:hypothetical protein